LALYHTVAKSRKTKSLACDFPSISAQPSYAATRRAAILGSAAAFQPPPTDTSTHSHSLFNPASPEAGLITGNQYASRDNKHDCKLTRKTLDPAVHIHR
jgi:hypothetical protein